MHSFLNSSYFTEIKLHATCLCLSTIDLFSIQQEVYDYFNEIRKEVNKDMITFVGVHVRRKMYDVHLHKYGFELVTEKWFFDAMEKMKQMIEYYNVS